MDDISLTILDFWSNFEHAPNKVVKPGFDELYNRDDHLVSARVEGGSDALQAGEDVRGVVRVDAFEQGGCLLEGSAVLICHYFTIRIGNIDHPFESALFESLLHPVLPDFVHKIISDSFHFLVWFLRVEFKL